MSNETTEQYEDYTLTYTKARRGYIISMKRSYSTMTHGSIHMTQLTDLEAVRVLAHEMVDEVKRNTVVTYVNAQGVMTRG